KRVLTRSDGVVADVRWRSSEAMRGGLTGTGPSRCHRGGNQPDHSHQVVGGRHQIASQLGPCQASVTRASEATGGFHPAEDLLNAFADALADGIADVARRAPVDRTASPASVLRHMRRDLTL